MPAAEAHKPAIRLVGLAPRGLESWPFPRAQRDHHTAQERAHVQSKLTEQRPHETQECQRRLQGGRLVVILIASVGCVRPPALIASLLTVHPVIADVRRVMVVATLAPAWRSRPCTHHGGGKTGSGLPLVPEKPQNYSTSVESPEARFEPRRGDGSDRERSTFSNLVVGFHDKWLSTYPTYSRLRVWCAHARGTSVTVL